MGWLYNLRRQESGLENKKESGLTCEPDLAYKGVSWFGETVVQVAF